jgi:hypothetical protein
MGRLYRERSLDRSLASVERQLKRQSTASVLARSGLSVPEEGVTQVDGTLHVLGDFIADGKVSNDALTNPVQLDYVYASALGYGIDTIAGGTPKVTKTLTTPAGFTQAGVYVTSKVYAINDTTGLDYLYSRTRIDGIYGVSTPFPATANGGSTTSFDPSSWVVKGLTGGQTFVIDVQAWSSFGSWSADAANSANINGIVFWFR